MDGILKQNGFITQLSALTIMLTFVLSTGCSKTGQFNVKGLEDTNQSSGLTSPSTEVGSTPTPTPSLPEAPPSFKMTPLAWESTKFPERSLWSAYLQKIISTEWSSLLPGANDITDFCPTYNNLDNDERANVWAQLFVAIAKFESGYSPTSRMQETTMGTDPVTNQPVYSEGLLQLSYQDVEWAPWCQFEWTKDKSLSGSDPKKTILNPYRNLYCGVGIMAKQIKTKGSIVVSSGVYWAVIKAGGRYQQIASIQGIVKSLPLCK